MLKLLLLFRLNIPQTVKYIFFFLLIIFVFVFVTICRSIGFELFRSLSFSKYVQILHCKNAELNVLFIVG